MKKILIVEDERALAKALSLKLQGAGYETEIANDGEKALAYVTENKSKINLVLLDLMMPNLDGFGFLEAMKEKKISIPTIISSNLSQDEDIKRAKKLGAKDFFVKSDTPLAEIVKKIKKFVS